MEGADALHDSAASWSLGGDKMLLDMLHNLHKKLMSKCQETNAKMSEMMSALDDASISLQNVNNKFMALSNSQFIESRVYEDDVDITINSPAVKEPLKPEPSSLSDRLRISLAALERRHEYMQLVDVDSDSCSDDDEVPRTVMKPVSPYVHRPLPYIIGSYQWTNKWHVGLLPEDSESDSSASKHVADLDEYSESEPDDVQTQERVYRQTDSLPVPVTRMSTSSSEAHSEASAPSQPSAADIAADIARRLGQTHQTSTPVPSHREQLQQPPKPMPFYRPPGTTSSVHIFSDEPPPLDQSIEPEPSSEEDDIFAELHKTKPSHQQANSQSRVAGELFGNDNDIFSDFAKVPKEKPKPIVQKSSLFEDEPESDLFVEAKSAKPGQATVTPDVHVKKPVGGISLFGSKTGTENIGAAILRRNRKKSTTSEESDSEINIEKSANTVNKIKDDKISIEKPVVKLADPIINSKNKPIDIEEVSGKSKEASIFDDLFAKPEKSQNKVSNFFPSSVQTKSSLEKLNEKPKKDDLFSDNVFDDIDDIFSTPVVTKIPPKSDPKKLFDDTDDLFADIVISKVDQKVLESEYKQSIDLFDNGDELFNVKETSSSKPEVEEKEKPQKAKVKSLFDNEDELFTDDHVLNPNLKTSERPLIAATKSLVDDKNDDDIFTKYETEKNETHAHAKQYYVDVSVNNEISENIKIDNSESLQHVENKSAHQHLDSLPPESESSDEILKTTKVISIHEQQDNFNQNSTKSVNTDSEFFTHANNIPENMIYVNQDIVSNTANTDNSNLESNKNLMSSINTSVADTHIFAHEPPEFEKPKEPKKSKNINALFEDDSDDETLFFKRNDIITDEKPETFHKPDGLFDIFHDEPPDLDMDFTQKTNKINVALEDTTSYESESKEQNTVKEDRSDKVDGPSTHTQVSKLKSINLNINVDTLLPGAAPKKTTKRLEEADGPNVSTLNQAHAQSGPKLVKSVSFEEQPDTTVLDNKFSKERAKIQVKRRPSTRRARLQAARISGIDFGEDSTDYSSSVNDTPRQPETKQEYEVATTQIVNTSLKRTYILNDKDIFSSDYEPDASLVSSKAENKEQKPIPQAVDTSDVTYTLACEVESDSKSAFRKIDIKKHTSYIFSEEDDDELFGSMTSKAKVQGSKIVSEILNDNLLNSKSTEKDAENLSSESKIFNVKGLSQDIDDLFGNTTNAISNETENLAFKEKSLPESNEESNIQTLGKVYKEDNADIFNDFLTIKEPKTQSVVKKSKSLFDESSKDDDDDELFNPKKKVLKEESQKVTKEDLKKVSKTKSIFESDDEDELFFEKSKKTKVVKSVEVKKSLFDDSDDDDGLFASATKKSTGSSTLPVRAKGTSKSAEQVLEDPLSLFGEKST